MLCDLASIDSSNQFVRCIPQVFCYILLHIYVDKSFREWPQPVLLKQMPEHNNLGLPVWDPRVSFKFLQRYVVNI